MEEGLGQAEPGRGQGRGTHGPGPEKTGFWKTGFGRTGGQTGRGRGQVSGQSIKAKMVSVRLSVCLSDDGSTF
jgi:hypothetical protein